MTSFASLFSGFALAFAAVLGMLGLLRWRARRRWQAAVDAYAEREVIRDLRRKAPKQIRAFATRSGASS
jgi:hypothetical protein